MEWINVSDRLPDPQLLGDGNVCEVEVKYKTAINLPNEGEALFGCSGFMGEPNSFFTTRAVEKWRPLPNSIRK